MSDTTHPTGLADRILPLVWDMDVTFGVLMLMHQGELTQDDINTSWLQRMMMALMAEKMRELQIELENLGGESWKA